MQPWFDGSAALSILPDHRSVALAAAGGGDRRRYPRYRINVAVRELHPEWHVMKATAVSKRGLFCPDANPRAVGTKMLLEVYIAPEAKPVVVAARVTHTGRGRGGLGLGLELSREDRALTAFLASLPMDSCA